MYMPTYLTLQSQKSSRTAITKYHRLGDLNSRNLSSHHCNQGVNRLGFLWGLSPWLVAGCLLTMRMHGLSSVCGWVGVLVSSYKDTNHSELGSILTASFYLNHLCKSPISKYSHILRHQGLGFQHMNLGTHDSPITPSYLHVSNRTKILCICSNPTGFLLVSSLPPSSPTPVLRHFFRNPCLLLSRLPQSSPFGTSFLPSFWNFLFYLLDWMSISGFHVFLFWGLFPHFSRIYSPLVASWEKVHRNVESLCVCKCLHSHNWSAVWLAIELSWTHFPLEFRRIFSTIF